MHHFYALAMLVLTFFSTSTKIQAQTADVLTGNITYYCIGLNEYRVTLDVYIDCAGDTLPDSLDIVWASNSGGLAGTLSVLKVPFTPHDVSYVLPNNDTCNGGTVDRCLAQYLYEGIFTMPTGCTDVEFGWYYCCRSDSLETVHNASSTPFYTYTKMLTASIPCNSSPVFSSIPVQGICYNYFNGPVSFYLGMFEPDGDSIAISLVAGLQGGNNPINYVMGYSPSNPLNTAVPITIDQIGSITCQMVGDQEGEISLLVEEYRNGIKIGEMLRTIYISAQACFENALPTLTGIDSSNVYDTTVVAGQSFCFDIHAEDSNAFHNLVISLDGPAIPGSTFSTSGGSRPVGTFCWMPTVSDIGQHSFLAYVTDNSCPIPGVEYQLYTIDVVATLELPRLQSNYKIEIQPNPATDHITISWDNTEVLPQSIALLDVQGRQVLEATITQVPHQLNVSNLPKGIYMVAALGDNGQVLATQKIVFQ